MKCKEARRAIVLDHYKELDPAEKARLQAHLLGCAACAADREETGAVLGLVSVHGRADVVAYDPDKSWRAVRQAIGGGARRPAAAAWRRFAPAAAGIVAILGVGILIGRFALKPVPAPVQKLGPSAASPAGLVAAGSSRSSSVQPMFASHLDDLRPILLDFSHAVANGKPGALVPVDERLLRGLLQNVLLRRALNGNDPAAAELLDDLDLILKEIINGQAPGGASPAQVRGLINDRSILFRMQILKTT